MDAISKQTVIDALYGALPKEYHATVEAIVKVEAAFSNPAPESAPNPNLAFEVEINVKRPGNEKPSSFLIATNGIFVEETRISERFGRRMVDIGFATLKRSG